MSALQARQTPYVCQKTSQVDGSNSPSALVFQPVPLTRFHGFGRIYRRIPDLLVDDRP